MSTLIQRAINLESLIMSLPGEHAQGETIGHLLDDFHDTYIGR